MGPLFKVGLDILATVLDTATGIVLSQLGSVHTGEVESENAEYWQHSGIVTIPQKATPKKRAAQAFAIKYGSRDVVLATRDSRAGAIAGELKPGESCFYAVGDGTAQGRILIKEDSSITLYTQDGPNGTSVAFQVRADGTIKMFGPLGAVTIDADGMTMLAGESGMKLGADGTVTISCKKFNVVGNVCNLNTDMTSIGRAAVAAGPAGLTAMAAIHGPSGVAGIASVTTLISP